MTRDCRFFMYSPSTDFEWYVTAESAKEAANAEIDSYRDEAGDGWNEDVECVCWGEIRQDTRAVSDEPAPPGSTCDRTVDYALVDMHKERK